MSEWVRLDVHILASDTVQAAIDQTPFAVHALLWALTKAGKARSDQFRVTDMSLAGAARRLGIGADDFRSGLDALHPEWLVYDGDTVTVVNWSKYQSEYMRRQSKGTAGHEPKAKAKPEPEKQPAKPKDKQVPEEAIAIRDGWNERRKKHGLPVDDSAKVTLRWIERRHGEGHRWNALSRCVDRYWQECAAKKQDAQYTYKITNFFGDHAHFERYLPDDWQPPKPTNGKGQIVPDDIEAMAGELEF